VLRPASAYASSKAAADLASEAYWHSQGLPIVRARLFNYLGPHLPASTALGRFASEIATLEQARAEPAVLTVGQLSSERDYLAVEDVMAALILLMLKGLPGQAYNVASGVSQPMQWYLQQLLQNARVPIEVKEDAMLLRTSETVRLQVDVSKLQALGWLPRASISDELQRLLDSYRQENE
jgi:GDP-4-dehydro-6-deoxy-D-mannose reductase